MPKAFSAEFRRDVVAVARRKQGRCRSRARANREGGLVGTPTRQLTENGAPQRQEAVDAMSRLTYAYVR